VTADQALIALCASVLGSAVAMLVARPRLAAPPAALVRTNVDGRPVPAVLGEPLWLGTLIPAGTVLLIGRLGHWSVSYPRMTAALAVVVVVLGGAGRWDDLQGDERPRGFKGHLGAARGGRVTGGLVKLVAGGIAGFVAGVILADGWAIAETAALVAGTANLFNLVDRAPGRAAKFGLVTAAALILFGSTAWAVPAAGMVGALVACFPLDLGARAMLGDAGSNPLGAVLGLGLAVSLDETWRLVVIAVLVLLNLVSERWSFSRAIESTPVLRQLDLLGRRPPRDDRGK
jgi:UDP-GlcNAc:undecaprenyl-phosphate/decaprenyl-phosphate GlcNAc-1-phosphate transferase